MELYGSVYVVKPYFDYSDDTYMWKNVDNYEYVLCWENRDNTITIRWTIDTQNFTSHNQDDSEDISSSLVGTFVPGKEDIEHLSVISPELDNYNLQIDSDGIVLNVPYIDHLTESVKIGTGTIADIDTTGSKSGKYVYTVSIDESAEAIVKLTYDCNTEKLSLETNKDWYLLFYADYTKQ